jgi:hypothetical protein
MHDISLRYTLNGGEENHAALQKADLIDED